MLLRSPALIFVQVFVDVSFPLIYFIYIILPIILLGFGTRSISSHFSFFNRVVIFIMCIDKFIDKALNDIFNVMESRLFCLKII